jgi:lactate dehydrogenase-like 2-hydroxyacid dehydrogenase
LTFPNVLITAHQAFLTHEALSEIGRVTVANLLAFACGQSCLPETALNPQPQARDAAPTPVSRPQLQKT